MALAGSDRVAVGAAVPLGEVAKARVWVGRGLAWLPARQVAKTVNKCSEGVWRQTVALVPQTVVLDADTAVGLTVGV